MDDWVSDCRNVEVAGERCRKTWNVWRMHIKVLGLHSEWAVFRDMWRDFIWANVNLD